MPKMTPSSILDDVLKLHRCMPAQADHFVLCNGKHVRYLISLRGGTKHLVRSVASYGGKLAMLLRLLPYVPFRLLQAAHIGYYAQAELCAPVARQLPNTAEWNMLVGTYDEKQKLVVQAFSADEAGCIFVKIGNAATEVQMTAEMRFLQERHNHFHYVQLPELLAATYRQDGAPFNIQVTREFKGSKVPPRLTQDIVAVYREIAGEPQLLDGQLCEFSHGDFVPWNLRHTDKGYVVFDWEHCGMKPCGYDLVYFGVVMRLACQGMMFDEAFDASLADIRRFIPDMTMDKELFYHLFTSVITPDGF